MQSVFSGMTDYSVQPISEILKDLNKLKNCATDVIATIDGLKADKYMKSAPYDISALINSSYSLFEYFLNEIELITGDIEKNIILDSHSKRLKPFACKGDELFHEYHLVWKDDVACGWKQYQDPKFKPFELMIYDINDLNGTLRDLANIAERLGHFTNSNPINMTNVTNSHNTVSSGSMVNINGDNNFVTNNTTLLNNLDSLKAELSKYLDSQSITDLEIAIKTDQANNDFPKEKSKFGEKVNAFICSIANKALSGAFNKGIDFLIPWMTDNLNSYFGL